MPQQLLALLLDADQRFLETTHARDMRFQIGFVHQTVSGLDRPVVRHDHKPPEELIKVIFHAVLFLLPELDVNLIGCKSRKDVLCVARATGVFLSRAD